jgi:hypothetical protein
MRQIGTRVLSSVGVAILTSELAAAVDTDAVVGEPIAYDRRLGHVTFVSRISVPCFHAT